MPVDEKKVRAKHEKLVADAIEDARNNCKLNNVVNYNFISGDIRILKFKEDYLTQESTPKGEIVLRLFNNLQNAEELVNNHLEIYDKMWDGCGCKIDYFK